MGPSRFVLAPLVLTLPTSADRDFSSDSKIIEINSKGRLHDVRRHQRDVAGPPELMVKDVVEFGKEIFINHAADYVAPVLSAGHVASIFFPNPVFIAISTMKKYNNARKAAYTDMDFDLRKRILDGLMQDAIDDPSGRQCETSEDCAPHLCSSKTHVCEPLDFGAAGTAASPVQELQRQYDLYKELHQQCGKAGDITEMIDKVRKAMQSDGDAASRETAAGYLETPTCMSHRKDARKALEELYKWMLTYARTDGEALGTQVTKYFYKSMDYYLVDGDSQKKECATHAQCGKYKFCSQDKGCQSAAKCTTDDNPIGGVCPPTDSPPADHVLCEQNDSGGDGCCWSTCSASPNLRDCKLSGLQRVFAFNGHDCSFMPNNWRQECCPGVPQNGNEAATGTNPYCCPKDNCQAMEELEDHEEIEEEDGNPTLKIISMDEAIDADRKEQLANNNFSRLLQELPDGRRIPSYWFMLQRRVEVIGSLLQTLEHECPKSLFHLFDENAALGGGRGGGGGSGGGGGHGLSSRSTTLVNAAEAARCTDGGFYLKKVMVTWAAKKISERVVDVQSTWAVSTCPTVVSNITAKFQEIAKSKEELKLDLASLIASIKVLGGKAKATLDLVMLFKKWEEECEPYRDTVLVNEIAMIPISNFESTRFLAVKKSDGDLIESTVTETQYKSFKSLVNVGVPAVMFYLFDKGSWDVVAAGAAGDVAAWLESAAWLAKRGNDVFQNSKFLSGDAIESFCIDAAFRLAGLTREIPN